jgi:DNA-binding response OmpR family regulator
VSEREKRLMTTGAQAMMDSDPRTTFSPASDPGESLRILVVEDEELVRDHLEDSFVGLGHEVRTEATGEKGLETAREHSFDAMVLDVGLPGMSGMDMAIELRKGGDTTPIMFLTGQDSEQDVIRGLELGADGYMTKPYSVAELHARIRAMVRRHAMSDRIHLTLGELEVDRLDRTATRKGKSLNLTPVEFDLLAAILGAQGRPVSREELLKEVWGMEFDPRTVVLDTHLSNLRKKLRAHGPAVIENLRGRGYRAVAPED